MYAALAAEVQQVQLISISGDAMDALKLAACAGILFATAGLFLMVTVVIVLAWRGG